MKKLIFKICLFLPVLLLVVFFNVVVDPAGIYKVSDLEIGLAKILANNKPMSVEFPFDERLLLKNFLRIKKGHFNSVFLGSSRVALMNKDNLKKDNFINLYVSQGTLEDYLALYYLFIENFHTPKELIIELPPWVLNSLGSERWKTINAESKKMTGLVLNDDNTISSDFIYFDYYTNLVSLSYFQEAINAYIKNPKINYKSLLFFKNNIDTEKYICLKDDNLNSSCKLPDGSMTYKKQFQSAAAIDKLAREYSTEKIIYGFYNFTRIDVDRVKIIEKFFEYLIKKNVNITIFLIPYHPLSYVVIKNRSDGKIILEAEKQFLEIAKKYKIKIIGSYDPSKLNMVSEDFHDGMHLNSNGIKKFLDNYSD